jgi:methylenetetrahydrofolate dehydrogenase (NADP+)/methenyltetrahydrofolate cyclohydrolase
MIIDGKAFAANLRERIAALVPAFVAKTGRSPGLAVVLVGEDPASQVYVGSKKKATVEAGMNSFEHKLSASVSQDELIALVETLNADPAVDGILVQLPLPAHMDDKAVIAAIDPAKDVDGLHPVNLGHLVQGVDGPLPCTPAGIQALLAHYGVQIEGRHVVIVGRGLTIGRPLANLLTLKRPNANAAVTVVHTGVADLGAYTREADIIIAAAGSPGLITPDMVKPGAAVVAAGVSFEGKKLVSDVADEVAEVAGWLSPRIGGVGPMTRAMLLVNTVEAAERRVEQG